MLPAVLLYDRMPVRVGPVAHTRLQLDLYDCSIVMTSSEVLKYRCEQDSFKMVYVYVCCLF